ncbi:MAG: gliding motility-associated C-terminal domain-containing protein [Bacteroidetes bacterium]|nr:gliding motility-associated C-terminal domain-containing protein [Bacteroidota bacterium]
MKPFLSFIFLLVFFCKQSESQVNLNAGLLAYYPFNGNANDASGNGLNGIVTNGPQLTTDKYGMTNNAYHFDGIDDVILVHDNGKLSTPTYTLAYYFSTESSTHQVCLGKINYIDGNGATYNSGLNTNGGSNTWFNIAVTNSPCFQQIPGTDFSPHIGTTAILLNEWHCIVNTFENGNEKIYLDGQLISNETLPFTIGKYCANTDFLIGSWWVGDLRPFKGKLDEVRFYNRVINDQEIAALCSPPVLTNCNNWLYTPSYPSYISVGDLDVAGTQLTVEATINRTQPYAPGVGNNNEGDIVSKHLDPSDVNYLLRPNHAYITTTNGFFATPDVCEIELNKTYHLAMVYDGATLKYYRNGFLMSQIAATGNLFQNNYPTRIGLYTGLITSNFLGYTNEVRIWNVARTQQQIQTYMSTSLPNPATQSGLMAYYTFDDLLNKQGNPLWNGTLNGSASINQFNPSCSSFTPDSCGTTCSLNEDFNYKQDVCNYLSIQFQATAIAGSYNEIKWDFGDGQVASATTNPVNNYAADGNYSVQMIVVKGNCSDTVRKQITIGAVIDDIITTNSSIVCNNGSLQLQSIPSLAYCWTPATYLDNPNSQNPISTPKQNITYYLTAQVPGNNLIANGNFSGGNSGFASEYHYTSPNVTEGEYFVGTSPETWNSNLSTCRDHTSGSGQMMIINGSPVLDVNVWKQTINVTPNTNYAFSTWVQALGDLNPAQLQFSINGTQAGTLISASLPACTWTQFYTLWNSGNNTTAVISIVNKNVAVQGNDFALDDISFAPVLLKRDSVILTIETPVVKAEKDTLICSGASVSLNAAGSIKYSWSPTNTLSDPLVANPIATPLTSTQYIVTGISQNGCIAKDTVNINISPKPVISKTADTSICKNSSIQLSVTGGNTYSWSPVAGLSNANIPNPIATPVSSTIYKVTITDANNCKNIDSIQVTILPEPVFTISTGTSICFNKSTYLSASGGNQYSWQPSASLDNASSPNPIASPTTTTTYTVLVKDTVCGASANLSAIITVMPSPIVKANKSNDIDCSTGSSQLSATGAVNYEWSPSSYLSNPFAANPVSTTVTPIKYIVKGTNAEGCSSTDSVLVDIKVINKGLYLMPSAFTPNNDGKNDCYRAKNWGFVSDFELSIFNRWGERMFHATNPTQCWDGTFKGVPQKADVYVYIIKAKSLCESSIFRKGTVALIR